MALFSTYQNPTRRPLPQLRRNFFPRPLARLCRLRDTERMIAARERAARVGPRAVFMAAVERAIARFPTDALWMSWDLERSAKVLREGNPRLTHIGWIADVIRDHLPIGRENNPELDLDETDPQVLACAVRDIAADEYRRSCRYSY